MTIKKATFCIITLLISYFGLSQNKLDDSVQYYHELVMKFDYTSLDSTLWAINKIKSFANDESAFSHYYSLLGLYYQRISAYDSAIWCQQKSLELGKSAGDSVRIAKANQRLGVIYKYRGDFDLAIEYFIKAKTISYALGDYKTGATGDITITQSLIFLGKYQEALEVILPVIEESKKRKEPLITYAALIESGNAYMMSGMLDEALRDYEESVAIMEELDEMEGMVAILGNIGGVYFYKGDYQSAIRNYLKSIAEGIKIEDQIGVATAKMNLAEAYYTIGKFNEAKDTLLSTLDTYKRLDSKHHIVYNYDYLYQLEYKRKDYQSAIEYLKLKNAYQDSILNENTLNRINELQTKYETAEKEQQIASQQLEIAQKEAALKSKQIQIFGLIGGLVILILFAIVFYNQYHARQNQKLQAAILAEKERGFESVILATEEERKRISKDLHDGIGQQLSALKMALKNVVGKISDEQQQEDLEIISEQFSKSADEVRQISHQMMPRKLMEDGLVEAIEDLLKSSFQFSEMQFSFEHHKIDQRFEERIEISLYRVLQELVNNIIKHSGASEVSVQLIKNKGKLLLFVEDNGKGMKGSNSEGHGLINIKSRLDMVKGSVNYEPGAANGTSATVSIPISEV